LHIAGAGSAELIAFYNDYENLVGTCTPSIGCGCNLGDPFIGRRTAVLCPSIKRRSSSGSARSAGA